MKRGREQARKREEETQQCVVNSEINKNDLNNNSRKHTYSSDLHEN